MPLLRSAGRRWRTLAAMAALAAAFLPAGRGARGDGPEAVLAAAVAAAPPGAVWAVDPEDPGPTLPPAGRSLFDFVVARPDGSGYEVPFPFPALLARVEERLGVAPGEPSPLRKVLIPLGRSLQRNAGAPDFFRFPRAVAAVEGAAAPAPGHAGLLLADRLYLGYQERSAVVEVISYNEAAGRFEFQVVRDYRPGGRPQLLYANRAICTACHQGAAPIFARALWDETNASGEITRLLRAEEGELYGFPLDQGVDVPYLVDAATDRANRFAAYQRLWIEGCGGDDPAAVRCRAAVLVAALQRGLTGGRGYDRASQRFQADAAAALERTFRRHWPGGLLIPDPDIPNRDPLRARAPGVKVVSVPADLGRRELARFRELVQGSQIPAHLEPLNPRPPLEVWTPQASRGGGQGVGDGDLAGPGAVDRLVAGIGELLAGDDLRRLDDALVAAGAAGDAPRERFQADCRLSLGGAIGGGERLKLDCGTSPGGTGLAGTGVAGLALRGRLYLDAGRVTGGSVERLAAAGAEMVGLEVTGVELREEGSRRRLDLTLGRKSTALRVRRPDGALLERLEVAWEAGEDGETGAGGGPAPAAGMPAAGTWAGEAVAFFVDDFAAAEAAVEALAARTARGESDALAAAPFRRAAVLPELFEELGAEPLEWCCLDDAHLPPPVLEDGAGAGGEAFTEASVQAFFRYCALCHDTSAPSPPNFLHGPPQQVRSSLAHCAERIFFRLGMWRLADEARPKTPMPPVNALPAMRLSSEDWPASPDLAVLEEYVAGLLAAESGRPPAVEELEARGYERLRECLPE